MATGRDESDSLYLAQSEQSDLIDSPTASDCGGRMVMRGTAQ
uniref:Uncharacterized protein n=3 Tax=Vibrionaceae TaxID=641 RepID=A0A0H3ZXR5_VIBSP|nr:hypothetical protein [Vibrio sp. FF_482]AKN38584.1 hypothetical protein [Enterovibrio norvegicus]AKN39362.1 hypothetical protein [Vibrio splendidus]